MEIVSHLKYFEYVLKFHDFFHFFSEDLPFMFLALNALNN